MNTTATPKSLIVWSEKPPRTGFAWLTGNLKELFHRFRVLVFTRFISFLGELSAPGMKPVGALQAWALRRMGAACPGSEVWLGPHLHLDHPERIVFGRRVVIGPGACLVAHGRIVLGDDFLAAPGLYLNSGSHHVETLVPHSSPIHIGPGVWCGARVTVGAGVTIGEGAVIGAGSVVLKDIPPHHVAHGTPCKPWRELTARPPAHRWSNFRNRDFA
jgi:acetyltransferase-like isoleucine patch superfamily enzyme